MVLSLPVPAEVVTLLNKQSAEACPKCGETPLVNDTRWIGGKGNVNFRDCPSCGYSQQEKGYTPWTDAEVQAYLSGVR